MRKGFIFMWLTLLFAAITLLFWRSEFVYSLPTPVPTKYKPVSQGAQINLPDQLKWNNNRPIFLHFFNPECPCSRFNIPHIQKMVKRYEKDVNFAIVVLSPNKDITAKEIQDRFNLNIPIVFDSSVAAACGVYSTPQAAIINGDHKLYYRGNYNKSRYCTELKTEYAKMALDSLLRNNATPAFDRYAFTAYGCQLPNCTK
jgi:thiol-disulfide isomerase/thioredoxin